MENITIQVILSDLRNSLVRSVYLVERIQEEIRPPESTAQSTPLHRGPGFELKGVWYARDNMTEILVDVLQHLAADDPNFPERFATKVQGTGTSRLYVARDPSQLYPASPHLARYSREFAPGWYVGTNEDTDKKLRLIKLAARVAGLTFDVDLRVSF